MDSVIKICDQHRKEIWDKAAALGFSRKRPLKYVFVGFESYGDNWKKFLPCVVCTSAGFAFETDENCDIATVKIIAKRHPTLSERNIAESTTQ